MRLETQRLVLRELEQNDLKELTENMNDPEIFSNLLGIPHPFTENDAELWLRYVLEQSTKECRDYIFTITPVNEDKLIGEIIINEFNLGRDEARLTYWISRGYRGKGYMKEAIEKVTEFGFEELKLKRLEISVFADNVPSNRLARKLEEMGFMFVGTNRNSSCVEATKTLHDDNVYSILGYRYWAGHAPKLLPMIAASGQNISIPSPLSITR